MRAQQQNTKGFNEIATLATAMPVAKAGQRFDDRKS
jgi:hypothetical protein